MQILLVWFGIFSFTLLLVALVLNLVRYARFPSRQSVLYILLLGTTGLWLTAYTYALFSQVFVAVLSARALLLLGAMRAAVSVANAVLVALLVLEAFPRLQRAARLALAYLPAALYLAAYAAWHDSMTLSRAALITAAYFGFLWAMALLGLLRPRARGRNPLHRNVRAYLLLAAVFYPLFVLATVPPVLLLSPTFFSAFPRELYAAAWGLSEIFLFFAADRGSRGLPLHAAAVEAFGLSAREQEVAALAIDGLPYREIADRLFISQKTVETHLRNIYRKCGASGRFQLQRALRPQGKP